MNKLIEQQSETMLMSKKLLKLVKRQEKGNIDQYKVHYVQLPIDT